MLVSDITASFTANFTTRVFDAAALSNLVGRALLFYNRYNPVHKDGIITTEAGIQDYDVEDDCQTVISVAYFPEGEWVAGELPLPVATSEYLVPARTGSRMLDRITRNIEQNEVLLRRRGDWEQIGLKVRLSPVPAADLFEIAYEYYAAHVIAPNEDTVPVDEIETMPIEDLSIFVDLMRAEYVEGAGVEMSIEPDFSEGSQRETRHTIPENTRAVAENLRNGLRRKYGDGQCAMLS